MERIKNFTANVAVPAIERFAKWLVRTVFELAKLAALAWTLLSLISAPLYLEVTIVAIIVAVAYSSKYLR